MTESFYHGILSKGALSTGLSLRRADCLSKAYLIRMQENALFLSQKRTTWMCGTIKRIKEGGKLGMPTINQLVRKPRKSKVENQFTSIEQRIQQFKKSSNEC